jgi:hypothetical protein
MVPSPFDTIRRPPRRPRAPWLARALALGVSCASASHAAPGDEAVHVRYSAPAACVDAAAFRARLLALPVSPGTAQPRGATIVVTITEREAQFEGEITVVHADGTTTARRVSSARCDEVSDALEFVAALALGLDSTPLSRPPPPPPPPAETSSRPGARPAPSAHWQLLGALRVTLLGGAGPPLELAPDVAVGVALDAPGLLAPWFELSGTWATSGNVVTSSGVAALTLWQGALAACPVRIALGAGFAVRPCAQLSAGAISGSGSGANVVSGPAQTELRVTVAPLARLEWKLHDRFALEGEAGPDFEVSRARFYFAPGGAEVYSAPVVGSITRVGVVFLWP